MCELCGVNDNNITFVKTSCCHKQCHKYCHELCEEYLYGCPICKNGSAFVLCDEIQLPKIKIHLEYGNYFTYLRQKDIFNAIKNKNIPDKCKIFGRKVTCYLSKSGDFDSQIPMLERDDIIKEINMLWDRPKDK